MIYAYSTIIVTVNGYLKIGCYVPIDAYCHLLAIDGIILKDFSRLSQGVKVYSETDNFSGNSLPNPTMPKKNTNQ
tara:strand:- start:39598 stop:39822 length:225 start_codon:yes stop_codon:yes gene_type:complete